jgi:hypothetical protein
LIKYMLSGFVVQPYLKMLEGFTGCETSPYEGHGFSRAKQPGFDEGFSV